MLENFRLQFAKIFAIVAISLVIIIGLASKIAFQLILIRAIIGGGLFSLIGYLLGLILDKEQEKAQMKPEQELIKTQLKHPYQPTTIYHIPIYVSRYIVQALKNRQKNVDSTQFQKIAFFFGSK